MRRKSSQIARVQALLSNSAKTMAMLGLRPFGGRNHEGNISGSQLLGRKKRRLRRIEDTFISR